MSPAPPGGGAAGSKASAAVVRKERVCWADRGQGPVPAASTESENPSPRSRTAPPHDGARRTRDARATFGFAPTHGVRGAKGDRLHATMPGAVGMQHRKPTSDGPEIAPAPRLRLRAGQDVAARAGIQPDRTRRTPLMRRASECFVDARPTPAPTPGIGCRAPKPVPSLQGQSKPR